MKICKEGPEGQKSILFDVDCSEQEEWIFVGLASIMVLSLDYENYIIQILDNNILTYPHLKFERRGISEHCKNPPSRQLKNEFNF